MADSGASHSGARSICREIPDFCDKIAGADFAGKNLSQKSGAKVKLVRLTFATRRGPDSAPLRTWCRFQDLRDIRGAKEFNSGSPDQKTLAGRRARNSASFGTLGLIWSATARHWVLAASAVSWAKAVAMKAETTRRPLFPAWARALRWKWTRHRCQVALRTFETAALMPSWASLMTSFTPRRPRRVSLRRNSVQIGSASDVPISRPRTSRRPSVLTPMAMMTATETIRPPRRTLR